MIVKLANIMREYLFIQFNVYSELIKYKKKLIINVKFIFIMYQLIEMKRSFLENPTHNRASKL